MWRSGTSSGGSRSRTRSRPPARSSSIARRSRRWPIHPRALPDLARLAHHADAAGDSDAVLQFAPAAAKRAAALGAHREAVAQYIRALRCGDDLSSAERAELLELCAESCYLTDQYDTGIAAFEEALACRRRSGTGSRKGQRAPAAVEVPLVSREDDGIGGEGPRSRRPPRDAAARPRARPGLLHACLQVRSRIGSRRRCRVGPPGAGDRRVARRPGDHGQCPSDDRRL